MGSYAECWLGSFYVGATKDELDPGLISLVRASDKRVVATKGGDLPFAMRRWMENVEDGAPFDAVFYQTSAGVVRDRLELDGYTLEAARNAFTLSLGARVRELAEWVEGEYGSLFEAEHRLLASISVDDWIATLRLIKKDGVRHSFQNPVDTREGGLKNFMLSNDWYGYQGPDSKVGLRLAVEVCSDEDEFVYDVTDLVLAGTFASSDELVEYATALSASEVARSSRTIVLTEGSSDSRIIKEALKLLYPHLADYYSFMDFEANRLQGGAGHLVGLVKAFAGSGIINRVIAVFDHDTAAAAALRGLQGLALPSNVKAMMLPPLDFLVRYPTLGPSGGAVLDVNGIAGSLELYLGVDVLRDQSGELAPVQWTGFDHAVRKYQGEVTFKQAVHRRFDERLARCVADRAVLAQTDWSGLHAILRQIFGAFRETDADDIIALHAEYHRLE
jgi:hypothetical protein